MKGLVLTMGKPCPLFKYRCPGADGCAWFLEDEDRCAIVSIAKKNTIRVDLGLSRILAEEISFSPRPAGSKPTNDGEDFSLIAFPEDEDKPDEDHEAIAEKGPRLT